MTKVYKMPVLMAFYNHGDVRMEVTETELLASWKEFFSTGTNWKDLDTGITYEQYCKISDKDHISELLSEIRKRIFFEKGRFSAGIKG